MKYVVFVSLVIIAVVVGQTRATAFYYIHPFCVLLHSSILLKKSGLEL